MTKLPAKPYDEMIRTYNKKDEVDMLDFLYIPLVLQMMFLDVVRFCEDNGMPKPTITRILDEKIPGVSTTNIHATGRAMDLRTKGFGKRDINAIVEYITENYEDVGAIGAKSGKSVPILYEDGAGGEHLHLQVRP